MNGGRLPCPPAQRACFSCPGCWRPCVCVYPTWSISRDAARARRGSAGPSAARQGCRTTSAAEPQLWPEAPWRVFCYGCLADLGVGAADAPGNSDPKPKPEAGRGGREAAGAPAADGPTEVVVACPACRCVFCFDCDAYIHESLHNCPGCEGRGEGKAEALGAPAGGPGGAGSGLPDGRAFMDAG
jgi:hypothetical protein